MRENKSDKENWEESFYPLTLIFFNMTWWFVYGHNYLIFYFKLAVYVSILCDVIFLFIFLGGKTKQRLIIMNFNLRSRKGLSFFDFDSKVLLSGSGKVLFPFAWKMFYKNQVFGGFMEGRESINCPYFFLYTSSQIVFVSLSYYFRLQMKFMCNIFRDAVSQSSDLLVCPAPARQERSSSSVFA